MASTLVLHGLLVEGGTRLRSSTGRPSQMLHVRGDSDRVADGIEASCEADPVLIDLDAQPFDFTEWARSGAAPAIRAALTRGI